MKIILIFSTIVILILTKQRIFQSKQQFVSCVFTCHEVVTPCVAPQQQCHKDYIKCVQSKQIYKCMKNNQNPQLNKIAKCFDELCFDVFEKEADEAAYKAAMEENTTESEYL